MIAARDGVNGDLRPYQDVGVSGRYGQRGSKSAWAQLQEDIEAGRVSAVYISVLDRAGRSLEEWLRFTRLCTERGVRVVDQTGEDRAAEQGYDLGVMEMLFAEREGKKAQERSHRASATQEARGDRRGHPPYGYQAAREEGTGRIVFVPNPDEPIEPLLAAVKETRGAILTACKLLNSRGIPTRSGSPWEPKALTRLVNREAPRLRTRPVAFTTQDGETRTKRLMVGTHPLSRLVRCHCGTVCTPNGNRNEVICHRGHKLGKASHGRWAARERHIIAFLREHTEDLRGRTGTRTYATDQAAARREELEKERRRLGVALADDAIEEADYRLRMDRLKAELASLADAEDEIVIRVHQQGRLIRWGLLETDREALGEQLRAVVREVRLDESMMPVGISLRDAG